MRKLFILLIVIVGCSTKNTESEKPFQLKNVSDDEWVVYEGQLKNEKGVIEDVELSLTQASVSVDSYFRLHISSNVNGHAIGTSFQGSYSVSYGLPNHEQGITINCKAEAITGRIIMNSRNEKVKVPDSETRDNLYFITDGSEKLILTSDDFKPLTGKLEALHKRSNLFTAEGYVTADSMTSEFFERNTMQSWSLAKLVAFDSIKVNYHKLATEKNEGIYLRALAYSIADDDSTNASGKAIVMKRILKIEKSSLHNRIE